MQFSQRLRLASATWCILALCLWLPAGDAAWAAPMAAANWRQDAHPLQATPADSWRWPVPAPAQVTRAFDVPGRYAAGHRGIDIAADAGTTVTAVADGTVRFAGIVVDRPVLSIQHPSGLISTYEPIESDLQAGQAIEAGMAIGVVAEVPRHQPAGGLHLGARIGDDYLDPLALLARPPRAVLLPIGN